MRRRWWSWALVAALAIGTGCGGDGADGSPGVDGMNGTDGRDGTDGAPGDDGEDGADGDDGEDGAAGEDGDDGANGLDGLTLADDPLSSLVALTFTGVREGSVADSARNLRELVLARVAQVDDDALPSGVQFPLAPASTDSVRAIAGVRSHVVLRWLDSLGYDLDADAPRFGANADFTAFVGDGAMEAFATDRTVLWRGDSHAGWIWVNHEYVSGGRPGSTNAPTSQHLTLAKWLRLQGVLRNDVFGDLWDQESIDAYVDFHKKQVGGSWVRVVQDPATGTWEADLLAENVRYDATSETLVRVTGLPISGRDRADDGTELPEGVVVGIQADCSGLLTPWGTIVTAEENVQGSYGELEPCWTSNQRFELGRGFDPGATITFDYLPTDDGDFGRHSDPNRRHAKDLYSFLVEIDPGVAPSSYYEAGLGHRKLGTFGRAHWENAGVVTGADWALVDGRPIVLYAGDDRRSGRIYKLVTNAPYTAGMTRAQVRALLDDATLYVAHFAGLDNATGLTLASTGAPPTEAAPGTGRWIELALDSDDVAPNAAALGAPGTTVGAALADLDYNGIGGFASNDDVLRALFTASMKVGVMELNRPEDIEFNPIDGLVYVAFTNHNRQVGLSQDGVLYAPDVHAMQAPRRNDTLGAIFAMRENSDGTFAYFQAWGGSSGQGLYDAANPDNILIDAQGGVWFGTDGNFGTNGHADALYFLDRDPSRTTTFGRAFRVVAVPSDAEATGPAFTPDARTLFFNVQHPGEDQVSRWPQAR